MQVQACPEEEQLVAHLLGRLHGERAEQLDAHLETCEFCIERAGKLNPKDKLTSALKGDALDLSNDESILLRIAESAYTLRSTDDTTTGFDTFAGQQQSDSDAARSLEFLSPPENADEIGRLGHYRILEVLGAGGMGVVFRAEDPRLKRQVALKVMKPEIAATETKRRFLREARATAAIEHDNIVTIHHVDEEGGIPFLAMRFLRGESLQDRLRRTVQLPISDVLRIGREVASGLAAAHERGLIHRDIKPDNIWLESKPSAPNSNDSQQRSSDRVKIVDFGLARADDDIELTRTGTVMGTPRYMSPEQAQGQAVDHRSDLFSLGAVLYHLIAGEGPFDRNGMSATLLAVINEAPDRIENHRDDVPKQLAALVDQLLEKDPEKRPQSADEVVATISAIEEASREVSIRIPQTHQRRDRFNRRRLQIGGLIIVPLILLLATVLLFPTAHGTLRIEVSDDKLEVLVDGDQITLTEKKWVGRKKARKHELAVKLGDQVLNIGSPAVFTLGSEKLKHRLTVTVSGVALSSDRFEIVRGKDTVLQISLEAIPEKPAPSLAKAVQLPKQLADLATGTWRPLVTKPEDLAATLNRGGSWKDGALEVVAPEGRVDGRVVFESVRGRRILLRADVERVEGHTAGLAFEGENRSFNVHGAKNRNVFTLSRHEKGVADHLEFEPPASSATFGSHDMALAMLDGHAGLYIDGKLVLERDGFKTWRWTPFVSNFNWEGKSPPRGRFRNIRVMVLDSASSELKSGS